MEEMTVKLPDDAIHEYKALRDEMNQYSQITSTTFLASATVTAAITGYGLRPATPNGWVFLTPLAIIIPAIFLLCSQLENVTRIAAYIKVFLESNSRSLNWETRWFELRQKKLLPRGRKYAFAICCLYGALSFVCIGCARYYWDCSELHIFYFVVAPIVIVLRYGILSLYKAFSVEFCLECENAWKELERKPKGVKP
jgi:hypothetical protein